VTARVGIWAVGAGTPTRIDRSKVDVEKNLEAWIAADPALLAEGLRVVGRQVRLEGGSLDLLGVDAQGRWVVVELKRERLYRETVAQALNYVACFKALGVHEVREKLNNGLAAFGDPDDLVGLIDSQLEDEEEREVAVVLVGTGVDPGLERVVSYLGEYELPVSVVTFELFALASGEQLLVREVIDEQVEAPVGTSKQKSVDEIQRQAMAYGVGDEFARLVAAAEAAGLYVRPYVRSVMFAPPSHKNRFLMAVGPRSGGRLMIAFGPDAFVEFFDQLTAEDVTQALGSKLDRQYQGDELTGMVKAVEEFLEELPPSGAMTPRQELYHEFWTQFQTAFTAATPTGGVRRLHRALAGWPSPPATPTRTTVRTSTRGSVSTASASSCTWAQPTQLPTIDSSPPCRPSSMRKSNRSTSGRKSSTGRRPAGSPSTTPSRPPSPSKTAGRRSSTGPSKTSGSSETSSICALAISRRRSPGRRAIARPDAMAVARPLVDVAVVHQGIPFRTSRRGELTYGIASLAIGIDHARTSVTTIPTPSALGPASRPRTGRWGRRDEAASKSTARPLSQRKRLAGLHPPGARRPRAGDAHAFEGPRVERRDAQGRHAGQEHGGEVLPAAARHHELAFDLSP
jgi:hypothetical protein